jgi:hypothetical protein
MSKPFSQKSFPLTWCVISPWSVGHCMSQTHAMCLKSGLWLCCRCFKVNMSKGFFDTFSIALRKCCQISRRCRWGLSSLYNMHLLLHEGIDFFPAFKPVSRSSRKNIDLSTNSVLFYCCLSTQCTHSCYTPLMSNIGRIWCFIKWKKLSLLFASTWAFLILPYIGQLLKNSLHFHLVLGQYISSKDVHQSMGGGCTRSF